MKAKICIPITAKTAKDALAEMKEAEKFADIVEFRIDYMKNISKGHLKKILKKKKREVIVTNRAKREGGKFMGNEKKRISLLRTAAELGADYIDVELSSGKKALSAIKGANSGTKTICSYHNFKKTPSMKELESIYRRIRKTGAYMAKIVVYANSINDNFKIFKLLKGKRRLVSFCMGVKGEMSRVLAPKYGSCITFASLGKGKESAPGQLTIREIAKYNIATISRITRVTGVIGEFAENSKSKYIHNACFKEKGLEFVFVPFKVERPELREFMENFREFGFRGAAVTMPHKTEIIKHIDNVDETAEKIGAVNTILNTRGKIVGYNTDYYGAVEALKEKTKLEGKKVLVIGAGGAARAIIYGLKRDGAKVTVANRTAEKAKKLATEFNVGQGSLKNMRELVASHDIIINATSVGMHPDADRALINEGEFAPGKVVMDVVYVPRMTKLIRIAKKYKCSTITGERMLLYQAVGQFRLWTRKEPDLKAMERAFPKH
jgi:3-dehydroquinate dehydratase/shikimate dehydrogenase